MIDAFDILAFVCFAGLLAAVVVIVVTLGSLPGQTAQKRGHPQAAAIRIAGWVGIAMLGLGAGVGGAEARSLTLMGILWPFALVWAYLTPVPAGPRPAERQPDGHQRPGGEEAAS